MFIEPNSHIKIYRNIESSGSRRPLFKTQAAQTAYFTAHLAFDYTPTTVVKHQINHVRVGLTVAQLQGCNYLSFVNPNFGNKVYYANIVSDPIYINNECTELVYAIDFCQTDMFNITMEPCYNDREQLTDEDYTKSVADPYDKDIAEFWTEEALPVSKDIEENYNLTSDQTTGCFYAAKSVFGSKSDVMMSIIAIPHVTPPNATEQQWLSTFISDLVSDTSQYGVVYINNPGGTDAGYHYSSKTLTDLFNGVTPDPASRVRLTYDMFICESSPAISNQNRIWGSDGLMEHINIWNASDKILAVHDIPLYMINAMFYATYEGEVVSREFVNVELPDVSSYHNKKLARYPFSYIRVETPAGDIKEYQFERFDLHNEGLEKDGTAQFDINFDYNTTPEVSMLPMFYKRIGSISTMNGLYNFAERISMQAIPQMPYTTDSFLANIAAANADILANHTAESSISVISNQMQADLGPDRLSAIEKQNNAGTISDLSGLSDAVSVSAGQGGIGVGVNAKDTIPGVYNLDASTAARTLQLLEGQITTSMAQQQAALKTSMFRDSGWLSLQFLQNSSVYQNFKDTKGAYVCDNYRPGQGTGLAYYNHHAFIDFIVTRVKLRDSILQKYDQWFSNYGYASGRYGVPRIAAYIANAATGKPHFAPSGSQNVTYVKTTDAHVIAPNKTSEQFWEAMLNGGCQFIKGEELT